MSEPLTCTQAELRERLSRFPGDVDFTDSSATQFFQWVNGHCMMWNFRGGEWECEEL